jgi:hypothetical protein
VSQPTSQDVAVLAAEIAAHKFGQRAGQATFNALAQLAPVIAEEVRATPLDPFHRDERLPAFWAYVDRRLAEEAVR